MVRLTLAGGALVGLSVTEPAASVRLLIPGPDSSDLVMPEWNGNEFLLPDGGRPIIRTFTPSLRSSDSEELVLDVVQHSGGAVAQWSRTVQEGDRAAVSGPGRGYEIDLRASSYLLLGDETAIPAISQLLEALPQELSAQVHIEVAASDGRLELKSAPVGGVMWHDLAQGEPPGSTLFEALAATEIAPGTKVWAAGEAAAMQQIRRHLFDQVGMARADVTIRGYWKLRAAKTPG